MHQEPSGKLGKWPVRLVKTKQAASYLGISAWKLRCLVEDAGLPFIAGNGPTAPWLFDIRDLDAYIEKHKTTL